MYDFLPCLIIGIGCLIYGYVIGGMMEAIKKQPTNADRIRAMSNEELAEYLHYICDQYYEPDNGWLDWLKKSDARPFEVEK